MAALSTARDSELVLLGHKANFGHSVHAAGLISTMVSALAMQQQVVPAYLNVDKPIRILRETDAVLLPVGSHAFLDSAASMLRASISGTSVSGDNVHIVMWS